MQETASPTEVQVPAPIAPEAAPVEEPASEEPQVEEPAPAETPTPFNAESWQDDAEYKAHIAELAEEHHRKGQLQEAGRRKELAQFHSQIANGISDFNQTLRRAEETGTLDSQTFQAAMQRFAPTLQAYAQYNEQTLASMKDEHGAIVAASWVAQAANAVDAPDLAQKYVNRLITQNGLRDDGSPAFTQSAEFEIDGGAKAFSSFVKDMRKRIEADADKKGYERGLKDGRVGVDEAVKDAKRDGKGPATASGIAGASNDPQKRLDRLSLGRDSDGREATADDRAWLAARQ